MFSFGPHSNGTYACSASYQLLKKKVGTLITSCGSSFSGTVRPTPAGALPGLSRPDDVAGQRTDRGRKAGVAPGTVCAEPSENFSGKEPNTTEIAQVSKGPLVLSIEHLFVL